MAEIITLRPVTEATVAVLVPKREPKAKAFWHVAGDLFANAGGRGVFLPLENALTLREFWRAKAVEAFEAREIGEARHAARMWGQLTAALDELAQHNRCVGRPSPYPNPSSEVAGRFSLAVMGGDEPEPPKAA